MPIAGPWERIVEVARRSPSTHNTQGWRIAVRSEREALLCYDRRRTLPVEDVHGAFNIINMGVFARAAEIAAAEQDYALKVELAHGGEEAPSPQLVPVAHFSLRRHLAESGQAELLAAFLKRRTARGPYDGWAMEEAPLRALQVAVGAQGHAFGWTSDGEMVARLLGLNAETIADDLQSRPIREELRRWTRVSPWQARLSGDGLWARCMEQHPVQLWYMLRWPGILKRRRVRAYFKRRYLKTQAGTPAVGWVEGSIETRERQFEAGRLVLDLWLRLTQAGVSILPFGSLYTNQRSNLEVGTAIGAPRFWLIFRMGYGAKPPASYRLPAKALFI